MDEILNFDNLTWWWYNLNAKKKKKISIMCLDLQPPTQITILSLLLTKIRLPWPSKCLTLYLWATYLPQSFVLFCLSLFIFFHMYTCFLHFIQVTAQRAHIQRYFTLHAAWNGAPVNLYCFPCSLSLLSSSSLSLPLSLLFLFSLPPFLSIFLPSLLSFFFKFRDT